MFGRLAALVYTVVKIVGFAWAGAAAFVDEASWLNGWLRAGLAVGCFTYAAFPPLSLSGPVATLLKLSLARSLQVKYFGLFVAGLLIGTGLLVKNSAGGYIGAFGVFAVSGILWCMARVLGLNR